MSGSTMAIIGCGNMGTAILDGILSALKQRPHESAPRSQIRPSRFIACVNRAESVARLEHRFREFLPTHANNEADESSVVCHVWQNSNAEAVRLADVILLACQPSQAAGILGDESLRQHLPLKLLLSICVGMSAAQIQCLIYGNGGRDGTDTMADRSNDRCYVVHAMPNMASTLRESATVLSADSVTSRPLPPDLAGLADWVFSSVGTITHTHPSLMNVSSVTGASSLAFFATALEGVVRGATDMGLGRSDALHLAAQAMKGTAELVLRSRESLTPRKIREEIMTPNGCTAHGVGVLQAAQVEDIFAEAMRQAVERVFELSMESS